MFVCCDGGLDSNHRADGPHVSIPQNSSFSRNVLQKYDILRTSSPSTYVLPLILFFGDRRSYDPIQYRLCLQSLHFTISLELFVLAVILFDTPVVVLLRKLHVL